MSDSSNSGLFGKLTSAIGDDVSGGSGTPRAEEKGSTGPLLLPTDEDVLETAISEVIRERQQEEVEHRDDLTNPDEVDIDLDIDDPALAIQEVDAFLHDACEAIIEELDRIVDLEENSVSGSEVDTMLYVIERNGGENSDIAVLGGGESLLRNACERLELTDDETDIVVQAHTVAGRENGFDRHLLLDTVAFLRRGVEE